MRCSSTAALNKVIGNNTKQPADTKFTEATFTKMIDLLSDDDAVKFLDSLFENIEDAFIDVGIKNNADKLFKLLEIISVNIHRENIVINFLKKHPTYFSQITETNAIPRTIARLLTLINVGTNFVFPNSNSLKEKIGKNIENTQFVLTLFEPQLQSVDNFNALLASLEWMFSHMSKNNQDGSNPLMNEPMFIFTIAMLGAIKEIPQLEEVLELFSDSSVKLDIYNKWQNYWRARNDRENHSIPDPTPTKKAKF